MYTLLRPTPIIMILLASLPTISHAMEKQEPLPLVKQPTTISNDALVKTVHDLIQDKNFREDIVNIIATSTAPLPLNALRNAEEIITHMIDRIDEDAGWPKFITLKHYAFLPMNYSDKKLVAEAIKTLKRHEYGDAHPFRELQDSEVFVSAKEPIFKMEDISEFITILEALNTLKNQISLEEPSLQLMKIKICLICREACTTPPDLLIDKDKINEDALFRLSCNHTFHMACLIKWLEKNRTCPTCREPFQLTKSCIKGWERW